MNYHHIYNRGAHKAKIFHETLDYKRMINLLYLANNPQPFNYCKIRKINIFEQKKKNTLVDIIAYCLMPNHIHIAIKSKTNLQNDPGITKFMLKLCTAYSSYYNKKYGHSGTIWQGSYENKIADDEVDYIHTLINYIHLNPFAIKHPEMTKEARKEHSEEALEYSLNYEFSSLKDYVEGKPRPQKSILSKEELEKLA